MIGTGEHTTQRPPDAHHAPYGLPVTGAAMPGQMMTVPLLISDILKRADRYYGDVEIVSALGSGALHRYDYAACLRRALKLSAALSRIGIMPGERVATLAWNGFRHLEAYYGVSGSGAVLHTLNPRLFEDQIADIIRRAEDKVVLFDSGFAAMVERIAPACPSVTAWIVMADRNEIGSEERWLCYEELLEAEVDPADWPILHEETAAGLCYTSGTTGAPKGVLYSHRSTVLHALCSSLPNSWGLSAREVICPVVPMFHANAWGLPYSAPMNGAKLVLPGAALDGASLHELFEREGVTFAAGVPTVWASLLEHAAATGRSFSSLKRVVIGGAACPEVMLRRFSEDHGVEVIHSWGMTETSPLATVCTLRPTHDAMPADHQQAMRLRQGAPIYGIDVAAVDDTGTPVPWDGNTSGRLLVKGPWVVRRYFGEAQDATDAAGWFETGDIANIDHDGSVKITDRSKDVVKSGGEWISSIALEDIAMKHSGVRAVACIAVPHTKWGERPVLVVERHPEAKIDEDELLGFMEGKIAKWWRPDAILFVEALPIGSTGKIIKTELRDTFKEILS